MKNYTVILLALSLLSCNRAIRQSVSDNFTYTKKDSVRIDTMYVKMPADTQYIELPFDCPDQKIIYKEGKTKTVVEVRDKKIYINQITKEDSLRILSLYRNSKEFREQIRTKVVQNVQYKVPKFIWIILTLLAGLAIFAYRKKILKVIRLFL